MVVVGLEKTSVEFWVQESRGVSHDWIIYDFKTDLYDSWVFRRYELGSMVQEESNFFEILIENGEIV